MRSHGEGSIYRDGARWVAAVSVEGPDGRARRRKRTARTQAEAREALRQLHEEARAGVAGSGRLTVGELLDDWLANALPARGVSPATTASYEWAARHIGSGVGTIRVDRLRPEHVEVMLRSMVDAGMSRRSPTLVRGLLSQVLAHAERRGNVSRNVARLAVVPPAPTKRSRAMTLEQARTFLAANVGDRYYSLWTVLLLTGLRPGEALGLPWDAVDLRAGRLTVRQALRKSAATSYEVGPPKTRKSTRTLDLPAPAADALIARLGAQEAERLTAGSAWRESGLVFTSEIGTAIDPSNLRHALDRATTRAGLGHWHPHELRHTAVSLLSAAGVPLERIADIAGHATTAMTEGVYRHQVSESVDAGKAAMESMFGTGPGRS